MWLSVLSTKPIARRGIPRQFLAAVVCVAAMPALAGFAARDLLRLSGHASDPFAQDASRRPGIRVLFVGNSFTSANGLATLVSRLGDGSDGLEPILAAQYALPGAHLSQLAQDHELARILVRVRWNAVVLQEQSEVPALPILARTQMLPAVATLVSRIRAAHAVPLLFETWGYRDGDGVNVPGDSYQAMQTRLSSGYDMAAQSTATGLVPVGSTWADALKESPSLPLWADDGRHPSLDGSYLTAAAFVEAIRRLLPDPRQPTRAPAVSYTAGLPSNVAGELRQVADMAIDDAYLGPQ